jgi:hypothetical protein
MDLFLVMYEKTPKLRIIWATPGEQITMEFWTESRAVQNSISVGQWIISISKQFKISSPQLFCFLFDDVIIFYVKYVRS